MATATVLHKCTWLNTHRLKIWTNASQQEHKRLTTAMDEKMSNTKRGDNVGREEKSQIRDVRGGRLRIKGEKTRYPEELACMMHNDCRKKPPHGKHLSL